MVELGWTWQEYCAQPTDIIRRVITRLNEKNKPSERAGGGVQTPD